LRVIPSLMVGSAIAGMISMGLGCGLKVPHGGAFVLFIPDAVTNLGGYLIAMIAGTVVTAALLRIVKPSLKPSLEAALAS
jgi:PTS system fructose-specific IIC component